MARFVVDIDTKEFDPLADKTATLIDVLENKGGFKIATVFGIMEDNRCQFDDPPGNVERMINSFRILHDCVLAPPESATVPKGFRKKTDKELAADGLKAAPKPKKPVAKKKRGRKPKIDRAAAVDAEIEEEKPVVA